MTAKSSRSFCLVLMLLLTLMSLGCGEKTGTQVNDGSTVYGVDPPDDADCEDDPTATGSPELNITGLKIEQKGKDMVCTITFNGNVEVWEAENEEKFPGGISFWFSDLYIEVLFSGKGVIKVVDGKAVATFEFVGNKLIITMEKLDLTELTSATAGAIVGSYPGPFCTDDLTIDTTDPDSRTPKEPGVNNNPNGVPNGDPNNVVTATGARYIMLTDTSPMTSGDFPGSDIDRIEVCRGSSCTMADVLAVETSEVVNAQGVIEFGGSDACDDGTYLSLGGGHVILTFSDPTIDIVEGDSLRAFAVTENFCAAAGSNDEQVYDVLVGTSEVVDTFKPVGECGATIPCRLTVPPGI